MRLKELVSVVGICILSLGLVKGQDQKNRLKTRGQQNLVSKLPLEINSIDGIPVYFAELVIKDKVFDVRSVPFYLDWNTNEVLYDLEYTFSFLNIPKSLFTDAEVVELISKYKWELNGDLLKVQIREISEPSSWYKSTDLPPYVVFSIKRVFVK